MLGRSLAAAALLFALAPTADAQSWRWSKADRKRIKELAATATKGETFPHVVEGEHWVARTEVNVVFTAELALYMDRFFVSFGELLEGLEQDARIPLKPTVEVYASKASYAAAGHPAANRGYYTYKWAAGGEWTHLHLHTYVAKESEGTFAAFYHPILLHEGTHVLLRRLLGKAPNPKWFDEGVAAWFQFYDLNATVKANRKKRYRRSIYLTRGHLARATVARGTLKLADLVAIGEKEWDPDDMGPLANEHYALAESVIDVCLSAKKGAEIFKTIYERLRAEETPPLPKADHDRLQKAWRIHVKRVLR